MIKHSQAHKIHLLMIQSSQQDMRVWLWVHVFGVYGMHDVI